MRFKKNGLELGKTLYNIPNKTEGRNMATVEQDVHSPVSNEEDRSDLEYQDMPPKDIHSVTSPGSPDTSGSGHNLAIIAPTVDEENYSDKEDTPLFFHSSRPG